MEFWLAQEISFATDLRLRGTKFKPREDEEAEAMRKKSPFKAMPLRYVKIGSCVGILISNLSGKDRMVDNGKYSSSLVFYELNKLHFF